MSALMALVCASCAIPADWTDDLPVLVTLKYELEDGIFIVVAPADKGGYTIDLEGEGQLTDNLRVVEGGLEYTSPNTGLTYFVGLAGRKPVVTIIAAGGATLDEPRALEVEPVPPSRAIKQPDPLDRLGETLRGEGGDR